MIKTKCFKTSWYKVCFKTHIFTCKICKKQFEEIYKGCKAAKICIRCPEKNRLGDFK